MAPDELGVLYLGGQVGGLRVRTLVGEVAEIVVSLGKSSLEKVNERLVHNNRLRNGSGVCFANANGRSV